MPKLWLFWYVFVVAALARAETAPVTGDFWDYFIEYGDTQGELFDPVDFAEIEQTESGMLDSKSQTRPITDDGNEEQKP